MHRQDAFVRAREYAVRRVRDGMSIKDAVAVGCDHYGILGPTRGKLKSEVEQLTGQPVAKRQRRQIRRASSC